MGNPKRRQYCLYSIFQLRNDKTTFIRAQKRHPEVYLEPSQTSVKELFSKIINGWNASTVFTKLFIIVIIVVIIIYLFNVGNKNIY